MYPIPTTRAKLSGAVCAATLLMLVSPAEAASLGAADDLIGSWSGSGRINYTDGTSEAIHCNAYYTGEGKELRMAIQCKSDKNPINIRSQLRIDGGRASGTWEERTFNASGTASGSVGSSNMSLSVTGGGFSGTMSVSFGKSSHRVSISTQGIAMSRATMNFKKR